MTGMTIDRATSGDSFVQSRCLYRKTAKYSVLKLDPAITFAKISGIVTGDTEDLR